MAKARTESKAVVYAREVSQKAKRAGIQLDAIDLEAAYREGWTAALKVIEARMERVGKK